MPTAANHEPGDAAHDVDHDVELERASEHTGPKLRAVTGGRGHRIKVGSDPHTIRELAREIDAGCLPETYVHEGSPVVLERISGTAEVAAGDEDVTLPVRPTTLRPPLLARLLAEEVEVYATRMERGGSGTYDEEVTPSAAVLGAVLARQTWPGLPVLRKVISTPVLRPDGTLLQEPGYDPATGYYLAGRIQTGPIPEDPTPEQVAESREFLLNTFLRDFPWRTKADKANYLALLATPILRPMNRALCPFGVVDATMPGSGKTILTSCVGLLVGQRVLTWTDSEEELRKSITTVFGDQAGVVVFDNLVEGCTIDSANLARLVTERTWTDRRLGTNSAASYTNDRLWLATGNNLRTGGDMASRTVWVRLDPDCPRPEARTGFSIPHLDTWILDPANQATVLRHLLILILDWTRAGAKPSYDVPAMRQFTKWAQHLGGFLAHHGVPGFLTNAEESRDLDDDHAEWRALLLQWADVVGKEHVPNEGMKPRHVTAAWLRRSAEPQVGPDPWNGTFPTTTSGRPMTVKALGKRLTGQIGRWRGDIVLRSEIDSASNTRTYWIEREGDKEKPADQPTNKAVTSPDETPKLL